MRFTIPRPVLLALSLVLIVGSIFFVELRLDASGTNQARDARQDPARAGAKPPPAEGTYDAVSSLAGNPKEPARDETAAELIERKETEFRRAAEITGPTGFVNADGVSLAAARGEKLVLLEFWTYSCYNCRNVQPHINAWHERYADDGLMVVGVHTPEFGFERDYANVEAAVREAGIEYPVVLDNDQATWDAYDNRYWPAIYLIDADGFIRYEHVGEGAYEETETTIRELLAELDRPADLTEPG